MATHAGGRDQARQVATINITPLVDVMLVLLVIFMVAAPLVARPLRMHLPQSGPATPQPLRELRLQVDAGGGFRLDGQALDRAGLEQALAAEVAQDGRLRVRIVAAPDGDYQAFVRALSVARQAGVADIASELR